MKILIDIGHPAHVHYSKNSIKYWISKGHTVIVTARNKPIINDLLEYYNIKYINRGKGRNSILGKLLYMIKADWIIFKTSLRNKPDVYLSFSSPYAAQVAWILGKSHIAFNDTEHTDKQHLRFTYPFSKTIITPDSYQNDLGAKQIRFYGIDEALYLHPDLFVPDSSILKELSIIDNEEYVLVRFVSWNAHHDYGQSGLNMETKRQLIKLLKLKYKVFISSEEELPEEFKEYQINVSRNRMHDVLAYASMFVGESGTMASESSFLGTYSVYINSLPLMCYLKLEQAYGLLTHLHSSEGVLSEVSRLMALDNLKNISQKKALKMKKIFINPTKFLSWFIENYPTSHEIMKANPNYQNKFK